MRLFFSVSKNFSSFILLACFLLLATAGYAQPAQPNTENSSPSELLPRLVVPEQVHDFGAVNQGEVVEHKFEIQNKGAGPLKIRKLSPSCGCTAAVLQSDTIAPGASTFISAKFDTKGFRGDKVKTIRVYTNDPKQTSTVLTIQGKVETDIEVEPGSLNFSDITRGEKVSGEVIVSVRDGKAIKIVDIISRSDKVSVQKEDLSPKDRPNTRFRVKVTLAEDLPLGSFRSRVVMKTSSKETPVANLSVFAFVQGDLQLEPRNASYGLLEGPLENGMIKEIVLSNAGKKPVSLLGIESDHPEIEASFSVLEPGRRYAIKVVLRKSATGVIRGRLTLKTDSKDKEQKNLSLPVYAIISKPSDGS
jgi:hypothetical protein